jgi:hypothetical protein
LALAAAGFASTSRSSMSNANTATSIAPITLVSRAVDSTASDRCRCRVFPSELISFITRSAALPGFAPVPRIE